MTSRKELSKQAGIPESTVERILTFFENEQQIEQQKTNKFRIITIKNWEEYQHCEKSHIKTDIKRSANGQPVSTYKNDKKRESKPSKKFQKPTAQEVSEYARSIGFELDCQKFVNFYEAKGWLIGQNKMKDWKAAVRTWKQRAGKETNGQNKKHRKDT